MTDPTDYKPSEEDTATALAALRLYAAALTDDYDGMGEIMRRHGFGAAASAAPSQLMQHLVWLGVGFLREARCEHFVFTLEDRMLAEIEGQS